MLARCWPEAAGPRLGKEQSGVAPGFGQHLPASSFAVGESPLKHVCELSVSDCLPWLLEDHLVYGTPLPRYVREPAERCTCYRSLLVPTTQLRISPQPLD